MAGFANEPQKVFPRNVRRRRVLKRVTIYALVRHQSLIENDLHTPGRIIRDGQSCDRARRYAERFHQKLRLAEGKAPRAETLRQRLEIDPGGAFRDDENKRPLLVLEKQVFR